MAAAGRRALRVSCTVAPVVDTAQAQKKASVQRTLVPCRLLGVGAAAPATVLSNTDLEKLVETNDEWIVTRTGIRRRWVLP